MTAHAFAPATSVRPLRETRLLVVHVDEGTFEEGAREALPSLLEPGDVVVVNDAATLPSSVFGTVNGKRIELRLLELPAPKTGACGAVVFGEGDWHTPTEKRPAPPRLAEGTLLRVGELEARVLAVHDARRVRLAFRGPHDAVVAALYRMGRAVQYAHMKEPLPLWDVQNVYAAEPWAAEMPSAGRPLDFAALDALRKRDIAVVRLTHGAGLSSIGTSEEDASLPWTERYRIPPETAAAVSRARRAIAVGTSVVRALESAADAGGVVRAGEGVTSLRIDGTHRLRIVRGLLTGMHDATTSHADLLSAFLPQELLRAASAFAVQRGFLGHEMGDSCLILSAGDRARPRPR